MMLIILLKKTPTYWNNVFLSGSYITFSFILDEIFSIIYTSSFMSHKAQIHREIKEIRRKKAYRSIFTVELIELSL